MGSVRKRLTGQLLRDGILVLTLVSQILTALGIPVPVSAHSSSVAYPCANRSCGCLTAEQCWAGDCCCFTLEEKLDWASQNNVEPPPEALKKAADRQKLGFPSRPNQSAAAKPAQSPNAKPVCCCCDEPNSDSCCDATPQADSCCAKCMAAESPAIDDTPTFAVRWVVGLFARKCRGDGPESAESIDPAIVTCPWATRFTPVEPGTVQPVNAWPCPVTHHVPPTPPPRQR